MEAVEEEEENDEGYNDTGFEENLISTSPEFNINKKRWKGISGLFGRGHRSSARKKSQEEEPEAVEPSEPKRKQVKFTQQQYISLARSWIRILTDSIMWNNISGAKCWQNVADFYITLEPIPRTWASLRGGYRVMNGACQNYLAILARLEDRQRSGAAPSDNIKDARTAYQAKYGQAFKFQGCFEILSTVPKWKNPSRFIHEQANKARRTSYSSSSPGSDSGSQERASLFGTADQHLPGRNRSIQMEQHTAEYARYIATQENYASQLRESRSNFIDSRAADRAEKAARSREKNMIKLLTCDFSKLNPLQREMAMERLDIYRRESGSGSGSANFMDGSANSRGRSANSGDGF